MIRLATPKDQAHLARITRDAYEGYVSRIGARPAPMMVDYGALIRQQTVWVADKPPVVGLIIMYPDGTDWAIESLAVDPIHHGQGLGAALLDFAEQKAQAAGARAVSLYTNAAMTENLSFYPAHGYVEVSRRIEDGFSRVYFRKEITHTEIID